MCFSLKYPFAGLLCLIGWQANILAQKTFDSLIDSTVAIASDVRLDTLVMRHIRVNEEKGAFAGFRVQLYSGSGNSARQTANDLRAEFLTLFPDVPAYLIYQAPNFKVRVGDFRTELEATMWQRKLSYQFPGGFVSKDMIKMPQLSIDKEKGSEEEFEKDEERPSE